uniref:17K protein n=1 Tax=Bovine adenovirus 2 TaxID=114429 RepID=Q9DLD7_ADEB2|nr:17K protein [Bovine adenovirus 2]
MGRFYEACARAEAELTARRRGARDPEGHPALQGGDGETQLRMSTVLFDAERGSGQASEARHLLRPQLLNCVPDLSSSFTGFVLITSPDFECVEHAVKLRHNQDNYNTGLHFNRFVYKVKWEGGGMLTCRVLPKSAIKSFKI